MSVIRPSLLGLTSGRTALVFPRWNDQTAGFNYYGSVHESAFPQVGNSSRPITLYGKQGGYTLHRNANQRKALFFELPSLLSALNTNPTFDKSIELGLEAIGPGTQIMGNFYHTNTTDNFVRIYNTTTLEISTSIPIPPLQSDHRYALVLREDDVAELYHVTEGLIGSVAYDSDLLSWVPACTWGTNMGNTDVTLSRTAFDLGDPTIIPFAN